MLFGHTHSQAHILSQALHRSLTTLQLCVTGEGGVVRGGGCAEVMCSTSIRNGSSIKKEHTCTCASTFSGNVPYSMCTNSKEHLNSTFNSKASTSTSTCTFSGKVPYSRCGSEGEYTRNFTMNCKASTSTCMSTFSGKVPHSMCTSSKGEHTRNSAFNSEVPYSMHTSWLGRKKRTSTTRLERTAILEGFAAGLERLAALISTNSHPGLSHYFPMISRARVNVGRPLLRSHTSLEALNSPGRRQQEGKQERKLSESCDLDDVIDMKNDVIYIKNDVSDMKNDVVDTMNDATDTKNDVINTKNDVVNTKNNVTDAKNDVVDTKNDIINTKNDVTDTDSELKGIDVLDLREGKMAVWRNAFSLARTVLSSHHVQQ